MNDVTVGQGEALEIDLNVSDIGAEMEMIRSNQARHIFPDDSRSPLLWKPKLVIGAPIFIGKFRRKIALNSGEVDNADSFTNPRVIHKFRRMCPNLIIVGKHKEF